MCRRDDGMVLPTTQKSFVSEEESAARKRRMNK